MSVLDFETYYRDVHGYAPFPWQRRLAAHVVEHGSWPPLLDVPTGLGKTSALDVALFALAARPTDAPRRVFLVVDRRIIVDQGARHISKILERLRAGAAPEVADALRRLFGGKGDDDPFEVSVLRGGLPRDEDWARRPDRPVLAVSTVDQVGSRLLFRGYGVSPRMAPIHAGLIGNDALFLLDEVHLAAPLAETLRQICERWRHGGSGIDRFQVVPMSATPGATEHAPFTLDQADLAHPVVAQRLAASKPTELEVVPVSGAEPMRREKLGRHAASRARGLVKAGARVVAVVVNRVDTARHAYKALEGELDAVLLTGRMRGVDRDEVLRSRVLPRAGAGRARGDDVSPIVVVATQSIEAGADLDFDGLVTECASYDALKQRFGRIDRRGERGESPSIVLVRSDQASDSAEDPVYGAALAHTWALLSEHAKGLDFGITSAPVPADMSSVLREPVEPPVLLPVHLDSWAQTAPVPEPDPDVSLWLHGVRASEAEVQVVWRSELDDLWPELGETGVAPGRRDEAHDALLAALSAVRVAPGETLALPLYAVRAWLRGAPAPEVADLVGVAGPQEGREKAEWRPAVRWAGDELEVIEKPEDVGPGDTLLVPCRYGGLTAENWDPESTATVVDLGDRAQLHAGRRSTLRLRARALRAIGAPVEVELAAPRVPDTDDQAVADAIRDWLARPECARLDLVRALGGSPTPIELPDGTVVLVGPMPKARSRAQEVSTEDDDSAFIERGITLSAHSQDVMRWAEVFVKNLGLPATLAADVCLAAYFHDVGKADPRFQLWLAGGSEVRAALFDEPLAKSRMSSRDRLRRDEARQRAGYPKGERHELLSAALLSSSEEALARATDRELVLHLVASHHGFCRPFAPALDPPDAREVRVRLGEVELRGVTRHAAARLDSGTAERFWALNERYGWWGLAWLEALVRLADHRASEEVNG